MTRSRTLPVALLAGLAAGLVAGSVVLAVLLAHRPAPATGPGGNGDPSAATRAGGRSAAPAEAGQAVVVTAERVPPPAGKNWLLFARKDALTGSPSPDATCPQVASWLYERGAADDQRARVNLRLTARQSAVVTISYVMARVVGKPRDMDAYPPVWAPVVCGPRNAAGAWGTPELDPASPGFRHTLRQESGEQLVSYVDPRRPGISEVEFHLERGQARIFPVDIQAPTEDSDWELDVHLQIGKTSTTTVLRGPDGPFHLSSGGDGEPADFYEWCEADGRSGLRLVPHAADSQCVYRRQ